MRFHSFRSFRGRLVAVFVGLFTGDGLMVFFNDPVPCPDPAAHAVGMAIEMRDTVQRLLEEWRRRGHALGFGTGIDSEAAHPRRRRAGPGRVRGVAQGGVACATGARLLQGSTGELARVS